jgi:fatty acid desaturase
MTLERTATTVPRKTTPKSRLRLRIETPTVLVAMAIYCGFLTVTWFFHDLPLIVTAPLGSVLLAWHSSFQHETIHGHPTNSRKINAALGWPPLALWLPYEVYRETHLRHHRCKGQRLTRPADDPESHYLRAGALDGAGYAKRALFWLNRTLIGRMTIGPAFSVYRFWNLEIGKLHRKEPGRIGVWLRHGVGVAILLAWVVGVCRIPLPVYILAIVYPSIALNQLRSFAEHRSHPDPRLRTNVVETNWALSLLFLNNNLHIAHHAKPSAAWYALPAMWQAMRGSAITTGVTVRPGYRHVFGAYFLRPVIAAEYPCLK